QQALSECGPVDGIIHTAGVLRDGALATKEIATAQEVFEPKALAAQAIVDFYLDQKDQPDFIALFSSVSAEWSLYGQCDYAGANAYLDGLALKGQSYGMNVKAVNWPAWREVGMAASTLQSDTASGLDDIMMNNSISPTDGAAALMAVVSHADSPRTVVSLLPFASEFREFRDECQPQVISGDASGAGDANDAEARMLAIWRSELKDEDITSEDNYFEIGGDSLIAVRLLTRIQKEFGQPVPISFLIKAPTVNALLESLGLSEKSAVEQPVAEALPSNVYQLREVSDSDLPPLFLMHAADGSVMFYQSLVNELPSDRDIYAVETQAFHQSGYRFEANVEELAANYHRQIRQVYPEGPIIMGGYSFGAHLSYQIASLDETGTIGVIMYDMPNFSVIRPYSLGERFRIIWKRSAGLSLAKRLSRFSSRFSE
ncbi:MAG: KR domain-containing protein, partial [Verrucomicrobiota bacterium]